MTRLSMATATAALLVLVACGSERQPTNAGAEEPHEGEHEERAGFVALTPDALADLGIEIAVAEESVVGDTADLPAEIRFAADRLAMIVPRVGGVVHAIDATEGDIVDAGDVLAVLDSGRLASLVSAYKEGEAQERYAQATYERKRRLLDQGVTSEAEFAEARQAAAGAAARREAAETALHAAGVDHDRIEALASSPDGAAGRYRLTAPIAGRVIERHLALGQSVQAGEDGGSPAFVVADDAVVWADVQIYAVDLDRIRESQPVRLSDRSGTIVAEGEVAFVTPQLTEGTRTATARVVLPNENGRLRPGQYVRASIEAGSGATAVTVPSEAVVRVEGEDVVFVPEGDGYLAKPVRTGRTAGGRVVIEDGLASGDSFVASGAFTLKAELEKDAFGGGHAH
ncbi:efflux RND transporter periplasmic adaptor subunit [Parvularcula dongshanensis]|uniref:Cobalt-zinc-cadmium efflux system membrane fusion protein n=1 Tax=Parvularcula dongshanensis TaxID=1173995 RepID=A0A840I509_9PROT|nr:efflux RND transporter periplasmic adaptor subunit [Parvularcula dongshanensis]MBB4659110.1 cobalt-zinc-cadmium efflux system membrane fusion protein [Parvularcula dongshanensis]